MADGARLAVVGISTGLPCGMRAHAELLAEALGARGVSCSDHWLHREPGSLRAQRAQVRGWTRALAGALRESRAEAVLLHYSVFSYSYRGFPVYVDSTLSAVRDARIPLAAFMHELVFPWTLGGLRGKAWALAQRVALIGVLRACDAAIVTTDMRAEWLAGRRWLASRPLAVTPVFSNLPASTVRPRPDRDLPVVGLFGYSYDNQGVELVLEALGSLRRRGVPVELALLGAPGRDSALAKRWLRAAGARNLTDALSFAGPLPAQELSDALATCELLLFADAPGPSSRKTTLAGSLASGRPLIATDGSQSWSELVSSGAARIVERSSAAVADGIAALLAEPVAREELGARGRAFAEQSMSVARSAEVVSGLLREFVRT